MMLLALYLVLLERAESDEQNPLRNSLSLKQADALWGTPLFAFHVNGMYVWAMTTLCLR
jgi:hypothetical protein